MELIIGENKEVELIVAGTILTGAGILALVLAAGLLARQPAHALVTVRTRNKMR